MDKKLENIIANSTKAIEMGKKWGVDEISCSVHQNQSDSFDMEETNVKSCQSHMGTVFTINVIKDHKMGSSTCNGDNISELEQTVKTAIEISAHSVPDPHLQMSKEAGTTTNLDFLVCPDINDTAMKDYASLTYDACNALIEHGTVNVDQLSFEKTLSSDIFLNNHGIKQVETQTMLSWSITGVAQNEQVTTSYDWSGGFSYAHDQVENRLTSTLKSFNQKMNAQLKVAKIPSTFKGLVILGPNVIDDLFLSVPLHHLNGRTVMENKSRFLDPKGSYLHKSIHIEDRPHDQRFSGATTFDGDGRGTYNQNLVKDGRICGYTCDVYAAGRINAKPNSMNGGPFSLYIHPGDTSLENLINKSQSTIVVDRFSGNTCYSSGDFSGVAKSSMLYQNGECMGCLSETMISGNIFSLIKDVIGISNESISVEGESFYPHIAAGGIQVST